jgi:hypothetical protein
VAIPLARSSSAGDTGQREWGAGRRQAHGPAAGARGGGGRGLGERAGATASSAPSLARWRRSWHTAASRRRGERERAASAREKWKSKRPWRRYLEISYLRRLRCQLSDITLSPTASYTAVGDKQYFRALVVAVGCLLVYCSGEHLTIN